MSVQQFQVIDVSIVADNPNGSAPMSSSVSSGSMHVAQYSGSVGRIGIRIGIHAIVNLVRLRIQTRFHAHGYCTRQLLLATGNCVSPGKAVGHLGSIIFQSRTRSRATNCLPRFQLWRWSPFSWLCMRFCDDHTFVVKNVRIGVTASTCRVSDTDLQWRSMNLNAYQ